MPGSQPDFRSRPRPALSLEVVHARQDAAEEREALTAAVLQRVETKLDNVIKTLGNEDRDAYGKPVGTGLTGRLMRLEIQVAQRFGAMDGWRRSAALVGATAAALLAVIWWLLGDKLGGLLR